LVVLQFNTADSANSEEKPPEIVMIQRTNICDEDFYNNGYNHYGSQSTCAVVTREFTLIETVDGSWTFLDSTRRPYTFYERYYDSYNQQQNQNEYYYSRNGDWVPYKLNITVKYSQLETIPLGIIQRAVRFNASHLNIKIIREGDFSGAHNVKELDLSSNKISSVPSFVFDGASRLETIDLSHNEIEDVEPKAFSSGKAGTLIIKRIYLNHNRIKELNPNAFEDGLLYLTLNDNQIKKIDSQAVPNLRTLVLDNNNALSVIPNMNVVYISLRNTSATTLTIYQSTIKINATDSAIQLVEVMFADAFQLQTLNLRNNSLTTISWIAPLTNLEFLDVSVNQLEQIDGAALSTLANLRYLNIANNKLLRFDQEFLRYTTVLQSLDLSHNQLGIFQLEQEVASLQGLGIAGNGLLKVDTNLRQMAPNLRSIRLNNNNWTCQHLFISLLLLHYDGIVPIDKTVGLTVQESPDIGYVRGIRCFQPLTNYNDVISTTSASPGCNCKTVDEIDNILNQKWNGLLKNFEEALENKMKQLDKDRCHAI